MQLQAPGKAPHRGARGRGGGTSTRQLRVTEEKSASTLLPAAVLGTLMASPRTLLSPSAPAREALGFSHTEYTSIFSLKAFLKALLGVLVRKEEKWEWCDSSCWDKGG